MASKPRRDKSPDLSELMNKLKEHAASFIKEFDSSEYRMREIVREFREIADEVRIMRRDNIYGVAITVLACGLGVVGAPFTTGVTLAITAAGGTIIGTVFKMKADKQKECVNKVKELRKEFMEIVKSLKNDLEEIDLTCEELKYDRQASKLKGRIEEVLKAVSEMRKVIFTAIPEKDEKLREYIIQSANSCQKVVDKFDQMNQEIKVFRKKVKK